MIDALRKAFLALTGNAAVTLAFVLSPEEIDEMLVGVIEAQVAAGWALIPPSLPHVFGVDLAKEPSRGAEITFFVPPVRATFVAAEPVAVFGVDTP